MINPKANGVEVNNLGRASRSSEIMRHTPGALRRVLETEAWRDFITLLGDLHVTYGPDEFELFAKTEPLRGIGVPVESLIRICEAYEGDDSEAAIRLLRGTLAPVGKQGVRTGKLDNIKSSPPAGDGGTSSPYLIRRLKKDRPDLAAKVIAGELSPHRAAVEAGIRQPVIQVPLDPARAAAKLRQQGPEWCKQVCQIILEREV